jgi:hypothetical protein
MEKTIQWDRFSKLAPLSKSLLLLCITLFIYEYFRGNNFTTMVVMLYSSFLLPSVLLTRRVQEKYFIYTLEYIVTVRKFTSLMSMIFFCIWLLATYTPLLQLH